jgi:hypothetical protein
MKKWSVRIGSEDKIIEEQPNNQCPFVAHFVPTPKFNTPIEYPPSAYDKDGHNGLPYVFYQHIDPDGLRANVQFCQLTGRKKDVFQCWNPGEWQTCIYFRGGMERAKEIE